MINELVLFYILGGLASVSFISSNYVLNRKWILILQAVGSIFVSLQFIVIDIWSVALVNSIFLVRNLVLLMREGYLRRKDKSPVSKENVKLGIVFLIILLPVYFVMTPITESTTENFSSMAIWAIPLMAGIFNIIAIAQNNVLALKWFILLSVGSWSTFDILTSAWTTLVGDGFSVIACAIAIVRLTKKTDLIK
jgi:membrane-associated HD superfamily phosphohydrolase